MKKLLTQTFVVLMLGICLYAQIGPPPHIYNGPPDDTYWTGTREYDNLSLRSTLGILARYSDVIGVGIVSDQGDDHFTVTVDHALAGCTNGVSIVIYDEPFKESPSGHDGRDDGTRPNYMPTNNSRIVFAVYTNDYGSGRIFWNSPQIPFKAERVVTQYELRYQNRSWWYPERDDGVLFTQFTNVIQAVRFDRNWTNFFYLCRDGAFSTSNRVKEDSYWDMRYLALLSTEERAQIILDDPLVDPTHKYSITEPGVKALHPDP